VALYDLSGRLAPGLGVGVELAWHVPAYRNLALGFMIRRTWHQISAAVMDGTLEALEDPPFVQPAGRRPFSFWVIGGEARLTLRPLGRVRPLLTVRAQAARRSFSLLSASFGHPEVTVSSLGGGIGANLGAELMLGRRLAAHLIAGQDWFSFEAYRELETAWFTTRGGWQGTSLRFGVGYALGR
jgi:hypothetical protein